MGQKVNPTGLRLGINRTWDSRWYAGKKEYGKLLQEDIKIRAYLSDKLKAAGVSRVVIERPHKKCRVTIHSARPGVVIGKKGADIDKLKADVQKYTADEQLLQRKARLDALNGQSAQIAPEIAIYHDVDHTAQDKLIDLKVQRAQLLGRYRSDAAPVKTMDVQIAEMERSIADGKVQGEGAKRLGVNPVFQSLQSDRISLTAEVAALQQSAQTLADQISQVTDRQLRLDALEPQYQGLTRDRDVLSSNVKDFTVKEQQTQASDAIARQGNDNISVVERAVTPVTGKSLKKPVAILGLLLGGFTALCVGLLRIFLREGFPTSASAGRTLELPVLAQVRMKPARG